MALEDYDRAIEDFTQAIKLDPNFKAAYLQRSAAYRGKNDIRNADADMKRALQSK
jgi:tetratricopeptide (TPR) repeat protein